MSLSLIWHPKVQFVAPPIAVRAKAMGRHYEVTHSRRFSARPYPRWKATPRKG